MKERFLSDHEDVSSAWEIWLFAIAFVLVFCVVAHAEEPTTLLNQGSAIGKEAPAGKPLVKKARAGKSSAKAENLKARKKKKSSALPVASSVNPSAEPVSEAPAVEVSSVPQAEASKGGGTSGLATASPASASLSSPTLKTEAAKANKIFAMQNILETSASLHEPSAYDRKVGMTLDMRPSVKLSEKIKMGARAILSKELTGENSESTSITNTTLTLSRSALKLNDTFTLNPSIFGVVPTDTEGNRKSTLRTGAGAGLRLAADLVTVELPITMFYSVSGTQNFHEFTHSTENAPNTQYKVTQWLDFSYSFLEKWSLTTDFIVESGWTYQGVVRSRFIWSQSLSYDFSKDLGVYSSVTNEGPTIKPTGESNINAYDPQNTSVALGVSYGF